MANSDFHKKATRHACDKPLKRRMLFAIMVVILGGVVGGAPLPNDIPPSDGPIHVPGYSGDDAPRPPFTPPHHGLHPPHEKREVYGDPPRSDQDSNGNIDLTGPHYPLIRRARDGSGFHPVYQPPPQGDDTDPHPPHHPDTLARRDDDPLPPPQGDDTDPHPPHHPDTLARRDDDPRPPLGAKFHHYGGVVQGGDQGWIPAEGKFEESTPRKNEAGEGKNKPEIPPAAQKAGAGGQPAEDFRFFLAAQF